MTRLFFATDVHGSEVCWRKFINSARFYRADVLLLGGDVVGKAVLLIERAGEGAWRTDFGGQELRMETAEEVGEAIRRIRAKGFYPYLAEPEQAVLFRSSEAERDLVYERLVRETLAGWIDLAEDRLAGSGIRVLISLGNDDPFYVDEVFAGSSVVEMIEGKVTDLAHGWQIVSVGWINPSPWDTYRELPEPALEKRLEEHIGGLRDPSWAIFNLHAPPHASTLDMAPLLDATMMPVDGGQTLVPVGSTAVRSVIERHRPPLALHGHIHESRGAVRIGGTLCINPGSTYGQGTVNGAIIGIERNGKISGYQPVEG